MLATLIEAHPYIFFATVNASLSAVGDFCAQFFFCQGNAAYSVVRTLRFFMFGFGIAPLEHMWNRYLEVTFPLRASAIKPEGIPLEVATVVQPIQSEKKLNWRTSSQESNAEDQELLPEPPALSTPTPSPASPLDTYLLAKRLAVDQIFMAPISFIIFLTAMGLIEGLAPRAIYTKCATNLVPILLTNWKVWPFIQVVQFLYIPLRARVPVSGVLGVMWTIYLSYQTFVGVDKPSAAGN